MSRDLVLRYSAAEHALRSTSDELPGVLVFAKLGERPTLAIDSKFDPELYPVPEGSSIATFEEGGISPTATEISIAEAVDGCIGAEELRHLYALVSQGFRDGLAILLGAQAFKAIRETVDVVEELAEAIEKRLTEEGG